MTQALHPIQLAARLTGLSTYVIRIWEQRYKAVEPERTGTNRRLYSQADIERLGLLRDLTKSGHSIGQVARLPTSELKGLVAETVAPLMASSNAGTVKSIEGGSVDSCLAAIETLDGAGLADALQAGARRFGAHGVLHKLVSPLVNEVGERWHNGTLTAASEHFATSTVRQFLSGLTKPFGGDARSPSIVVATPAGQLHELGVLLVCAVASNLGWRVTNLGASLPAIEIAGAAEKTKARAVALSIVYPADDPELPEELRALRKSLPAGTTMIAGGRAARAYDAVLAEIDARTVDDIGRLGSLLDRLRQSASAGSGSAR